MVVDFAQYWNKDVEQSEWDKLQDPNVVSELERRFKVMMENFDVLSPMDTGATGSKVMFRRILAPIGYDCKPDFPDTSPSFMDEEYNKRCMSDADFMSPIYDSVFDRLFEQVPIHPDYAIPSDFEGEWDAAAAEAYYGD